MKLSLVIVLCSTGVHSHVTNTEEPRGLGRSLADKSEGMADFSFSNVIAFGDSTLDIGNLQSVPEFSEFPVRFTTDFGVGAKVFVEYVADAYGIPMTLSNHLVGSPPFGNNFGVAGARSTPANFTGFASTDNPLLRVPVQVQAYLNSVGGAADPDALYIISTGGNDVIDAHLSVWTQKNTTEEILEFLEFTASSLAQTTKTLIDSGAKYVVPLLVPDVGESPYLSFAADAAPSELGTELSSAFNTFLESEIEKVESVTGIDVMMPPAFDISEKAATNGFQIDLPCITFGFGLPFADPPVPPNPAVPFEPECFPTQNASIGFGFWDEIHVNTHVHKLAAMKIIEFVEGKVNSSDTSAPTASPVASNITLAPTASPVSMQAASPANNPKAGYYQPALLFFALVLLGVRI